MRNDGIANRLDTSEMMKCSYLVNLRCSACCCKSSATRSASALLQLWLVSQHPSHCAQHASASAPLRLRHISLGSQHPPHNMSVLHTYQMHRFIPLALMTARSDLLSSAMYCLTIQAVDKLMFDVTLRETQFVICKHSTTPIDACQQLSH